MSDPAEGANTSPNSVADESLRQLYNSHGSAVLNYLIRLTGGDRHRAEDILQETLMRAWRHPEARSVTGEWSRPWLFTVARRIAIDQARAAMTRPSEFYDERLDDRPELDDGYERLVDREEVRAALASLPDRLRDVLIEIYFLDHSVAEAAEALGVPAGTIKSRTFYGLRALREVLIERAFLQSP
ncbi:MAG: polymerase sigma-70 factor, subfamily [Micromonosporaceae bacterium]|jgi:RNA polymerase sigma-70 factor (ECF subfamily)|nr:polymerase sigma-70 factor, subfamily [Micromonosporaceae bacterium]